MQYDYTQSATEPAMNYYINDHLGTPVLMVDRTPQENYNLTTGPFGEGFGEFKTEGITQNVRFSGQMFDESTGYSQNHFRDYDSSTGRYLESDPIGLWGGLNTYAYVEGNPVMYVDYLGLIFQGGDGKYHTNNPSEHLPLPPPDNNGICFFGYCLKPPACWKTSPNFQSCHICCSTTKGDPSDCIIKCSNHHKDPTNPNPDLGCKNSIFG